MKVVLFGMNGSWAHSCLALRCLRAPLERAGFETVLLEGTLKDRSSHLLERLWRERADIYGFSCYIWNLQQILPLAQTLHSLLPECRILLGGPEVSYATERFEGMEWIDGIISGEGELSLPEVCAAIRDGKEIPRVTVGKIPDVMKDEGILYREGEVTGTTLYYESSRGCPYSCAYCLSSATHGVRMKTVEQTLADMEAFERLPTACNIIKFVDRTFNADVRRANAIWRALSEERFTRHYQFEVCASLLNEESFEVLSRFPKGKIQLEFGLQSTEPRTLAEVSRHVDPEQTLTAVRRIHEMGNIHVHLDLIAGLPYEGYDRFAQSFDEAWGTCDLLQMGFLKLLYGTRLREHAADYGYVCLPEPPYTVLRSKWISYPEMQRLFRIAETLERYVESDRFPHTLWILSGVWRSPFRFFEGLTEHLAASDPRPLQKLSQPEVYRAILAYSLASVPGIDPSVLREALCADFRENEHKNPPAFLERETAK